MWRYVLPLMIFSATAALAQSNGPPPRSTNANQPPQSVSSPTQNKSQYDSRGTNESPLVVKVLPTPKTQKEAAQDEAKRRDQSSANWWMVRLTGIIAVIGLIQAAVFWIQADRLKQTISKMDEIATSQTADMKASIAEATRSANALREVSALIATQVETTTTMAATQRDFWARQMRAYVLPENGSIWDGMTLDVPQPARKGIPGVVLGIRNSGATPAYNVVSWASIDVTDVKNEATLIAPKLQPQFTNTLAPHGLFTKALWFHRPLTSHEISDIATGVRAIYVYGRIEYRDVMGKDRFSNFRLRYNGAYPPGKGTIFNFAETGNDAN